MVSTQVRTPSFISRPAHHRLGHKRFGVAVHPHYLVNSMAYEMTSMAALSEHRPQRDETKRPCYNEIMRRH